MVIFKYTLKIVDVQSVSCIAGAEFLTVQVQNGTLQLWAMCTESKRYESRTLYIFETGNPIKFDTYKNSKYISTIQLNGFVWHIFEKV